LNRKAEFKLQSFLIGIAFVSLAAGVFAATFSSLGPGYGFSDDYSSVDEYNAFSSKNLSQQLDTVATSVESVSIDANVFDWFSNIWNKLTSPFRIVYRTYTTAQDLGANAAGTFQLFPVFQEFLDAAIVILIIVGIVMIKMYLGRVK